jgi:hypothetical protein
MQFKKTFLAITAAVTITSGLAMSESASARVVCNREGDCWRTHADVRYPREYGVRVYSDRYADQAYREHRWHDNNRRWHDEGHDGERGAYRNGAWVGF